MILSTRKKATHFAKKSGVYQVKKKKRKSKAQGIRKLAGTKAYPVRYRVTSASSGNRYTIAWSLHRGWTCNCQGHMFWGSMCKHIRAVITRHGDK